MSSFVVDASRALAGPPQHEGNPHSPHPEAGQILMLRCELLRASKHRQLDYSFFNLASMAARFDSKNGGSDRVSPSVAIGSSA